MITQIKTGSREEWLELRKKYIGGSDASAVIGANPYRSAYALWAEKMCPMFNVCNGNKGFWEDVEKIEVNGGLDNAKNG